jgi:opacity protein-like surface antigen
VLVVSLLAVFLAASLASADIIEQFAIGTRVKSWELMRDKNFIGSITSDTVSEKDELYPSNVNLLFLFCPYGGLSVEWDRFGATMEKDGKLTWDTFTMALNFRYPLAWETHKIVPYGVLGLTYSLPKFDENNWWRYGWASQEEYDNAQRNRPASGDPQQYLSTGRVRDMSLDNALGWTYGLGVDFFLTKNLALNLDLRFNRAVADAHYTIVSDDGKDTLLKRDFDYSLDTVSYGIGFRWYF